MSVIYISCRWGGGHKIEMTFIYRPTAESKAAPQSQAAEECRADEAGCIHANRVGATAKAGAQDGGASPAWGTASLRWRLCKPGTGHSELISSDWWGSVAGRLRKEKAAGGGGRRRLSQNINPWGFPQLPQHTAVFISLWKHNQRSIFKRFVLLNGRESFPERSAGS